MMLAKWVKQVCFVALFSFLSLSALTEDVSGEAEDFTLKSNNGNNIRLKELRGEVVLINFWASWCGPCREEIPHLDELQKKYSKLGFTVLGINIDDKTKKADKILKASPVTFPVLYDTKKQVSTLYDVSAMPTTVIVDRNGQKRFLHLGYETGDEAKYEKVIKQLVRE